jgi:hypothetical protein
MANTLKAPRLRRLIGNNDGDVNISSGMTVAGNLTVTGSRLMPTAATHMQTLTCTGGTHTITVSLSPALVICNQTSGGAGTVTMPGASAGFMLHVSDGSGTSTTGITLTAASGDTIGTAATTTVVTKEGASFVAIDSAVWQRVS